MRYSIIFYLLAFLLTAPAFSQFSISSSGEHTFYDYKNDLESSTDLNHIFVLNGLDGNRLIFQGDGSAFQFYKYTQSPSERIPLTDSDISYYPDNNTYEIKNLADGCGYIAESGAKPTNSVWIVDYSRYKEELNSLSINDAATDKCSYVEFILDKQSPSMHFNDSRGAIEIKRRYNIEYTTLSWNTNNDSTFVEEVKVDPVYYSTPFKIDAPLLNTDFSLTGDQFAEHFGIAQSLTTSGYEVHKIEIHPYIKIVSQGDNSEDEVESPEGLYYAPVEMNFYSNANEDDAQLSYSWKVFHNTNPEDSDNYDLIRNTDNFSYTFTEAGKYTVTLSVTNLNSQCEATESMEFQISESRLEFPNFLSPGSNKEGVPNIFKASVYKSIIDFKCTILNRWGNKIYEWTDPSEGWDGTYEGKTVSPGVYFYVVEAEGSDGQIYKKGADINVLY